MEYVAAFQETSSLADELELAVEEVETLTNMINNHLRPDVAEVNKDMELLLQQLHKLSATVQIANMIKEADSGGQAQGHGFTARRICHGQGEGEN